MPSPKENVIILGSGFGGCLAAAVLQKLGFRCFVFDKQQHPRFAIGESSTPIADAMLELLVQRFDLKGLRPLARYGTWKKTFPNVGVGKKRGFSYFFHQAGQAFSTDDRHENQLLVAASASDDLSDTHWYRHDVDLLFLQEARRVGAEVFEGIHDIQLERCSTGGWKVVAKLSTRADPDDSTESLNINASFVVDATGGASVIPRMLNVPSATAELKTHSSAIFAHVNNLPSWQSVMQDLGLSCNAHPYPCDAAAVHHVIEEGWLWQLPFDNGITSVGLMLDQSSPSVAQQFDDQFTGTNPHSIWTSVLQKYPSLEKQFRHAVAVTPEPLWRCVQRVQCLWRKAAGADWICLPAAAGQIDALHSTGIAHTLFAIARLATQLEIQPSPSSREQLLPELGRQTIDELRWIDTLVDITYRSRARFSTWSAACMLYFASATYFEQNWIPAIDSTDDLATSFNDRIGFLAAHDAGLRTIGNELWLQSQRLGRQPNANQECQFEEQVKAAIAPYNRVGLFEPAVANMYSRTNAPNK